MLSFFIFGKYVIDFYLLLVVNGKLVINDVIYLELFCIFKIFVKLIIY